MHNPDSLAHCTSDTMLIFELQLVIMNLMAGNRDPVAFNHPEEFIPERWLDGRKGRTDLPGQGGEKLGVAHLTYGCGRRVCPGIDSTCRTKCARQ